MADVLAIALIGWLGGVLVNYLSDILPVRRRLAAPVCVYCYASPPVWNYLLWPRRCPECQRRRPWRVWAVEIVSIGASIWLWSSPPERLGYFWGLVLLLYFGVVMVIDLEHRLILHPVSVAGAVLGLGVGIGLHGVWQTLAGGAVGFVVMLGLYYLGELFARGVARLRGEILDEVALGFGDVNLAGVLGLILGWPGIVAGLLLAVMLGGIFSLLFVIALLVARRYRSFIAIPYGPFLVASAVALLFFRERILSVLALH
ncbi:MAG: A24 family peptidase [Chloroflexota bacterium]